MEIREGYKQTEVGVIPENWGVKHLGELGIFKKGKGIKKDEVLLDGLPCIRYGELYTHHNEYVKKINSFISIETAKQSQKITRGDILFAGSGETKEEIGKCVAFLNDEETYAGGDVIIFSSKACSSLYLGFLLNHTIIAKQKAQYGQGDAVVHIYPYGLSKIQIPLPPTKAEQSVIATALCDTDALISSLEKLIEKKRAINQGAMQQLLTAKEDWELTPLKKVCWFQEGPGVRNHQFTTSGVKLLNGTNIENGHLLLDKTVRFISEQEAYGWYSHFLAEAGDIIIACSGVSIERFDEKVTFVEEQHLPLCMNTSTMRFKIISSKLYKGYFYHFLKSDSFKEQISGKATGSAQLNFGPSHVQQVQIALPEIDDQISFSTILTDIDAEILALTQKLTKYKLLKQGMMQELLTGKTRLV